MSEVLRDELERRLGEEGLVMLDVRSHEEFVGHAGYPCDARQGHIPGARHIDLQVLMQLPDGETIREYVGAPAGAEVIAYCHSGGRSAMAVRLFEAAGYRARNYPGSWHEWAADDALPIESP